MVDDNLAERLPGLVVTKRRGRFAERKHTVDYRLELIHRNRAIHGLEMRAILELWAFVNGLSARILANVVLRVVAVTLFAYYRNRPMLVTMP